MIEPLHMSRRFFLGGLMALTATPVLAKVGFLTSLPTIRADGKWDDTAGLQALLDHQKFLIEGEGFTAEEGLVKGAMLRLTQPLRLSEEAFEFAGCIIDVKELEGRDPLLFSGEAVRVVRNTTWLTRHHAITTDGWSF